MIVEGVLSVLFFVALSGCLKKKTDSQPNLELSTIVSSQLQEATERCREAAKTENGVCPKGYCSMMTFPWGQAIDSWTQVDTSAGNVRRATQSSHFEPSLSLTYKFAQVDKSEQFFCVVPEQTVIVTQKKFYTLSRVSEIDELKCDENCMHDNHEEKLEKALSLFEDQIASWCVAQQPEFSGGCNTTNSLNEVCYVGQIKKFFSPEPEVRLKGSASWLGNHFFMGIGLDVKFGGAPVDNVVQSATFKCVRPNQTQLYRSYCYLLYNAALEAKFISKIDAQCANETVPAYRNGQTVGGRTLTPKINFSEMFMTKVLPPEVLPRREKEKSVRELMHLPPWEPQVPRLPVIKQ